MTKKFALHSLPAKFDVPAFGEIRIAPPSVDRLHDRLQDVGEDRPDHEVDLVALDQRLDLADRDVRLQFVVLHDDLDLAPAELAAQRLDAELEAVAQLPAEHGGRTRERRDDADLELLLRLRGASQQRGERQGSAAAEPLRRRHVRYSPNRAANTCSRHPQSFVRARDFRVSGGLRQWPWNGPVSRRISSFNRNRYRQEATEAGAAAAHRLAGQADSRETAPGSGRWRCGPRGGRR